MAKCWWCGEWIYDGHLIDDFDTCGKRECEREARYAEQDAREERMYEAERDDYSRY